MWKKSGLKMVSNALVHITKPSLMSLMWKIYDPFAPPKLCTNANQVYRELSWKLRFLLRIVCLLFSLLLHW